MAAIKASGINYFFDQIGLNTGLFDVMYTFQEGVGTQINSIPDARDVFTGTLSSAGQFWSKPGSGFFSGNSVSIVNGSGLSSTSFTHLFAYEQRISGQPQILLSSKIGNSGYTIGLTAANRTYFDAYNGQEIVAASYNNLSSKNLIAVTYLNNSLSLGLYNWNSQSFETETFNYPFGTMRSDVWTLGSAFTGYMDYYIYLGQYCSPTLLNRLASGFYNIPTGEGFETETICTTGITGYSRLPFTLTGITGYYLSNTGTNGIGIFTGLFPGTSITVVVTGLLSSGTVYVPQTGSTCTTYTGAAITLFNTMTGYALSYGMDKILVMNYVQSNDILKYGNSTVAANDIYNKSPSVMISGFDTQNFYQTGQLNLFFNGLYQASYEFSISQNYLTVSGADIFDYITYDVYSGTQTIVTGGPFVFALNYTGQEIYLNGLNLVSGYDFTISGGTFRLTNNNTGISGYVMISPVGMRSTTGNYTVLYSGKFDRGSSNLYFNGQRQQLDSDFVEGGRYDLLLSNSFNEYVNTTVYDNNGESWETN